MTFLTWLIYLLLLPPLMLALVMVFIMYRNRALMAIPGPPPIPFFGNKTPRNVQDIYDLVSDNVRRYGQTSRIYLGPVIRVLTCEVEILEYIMKSNVSLKKSLQYDLFQEWVGDGLIMSDGEKWRRMRKILTPTFHFSILKDFTTTINQTSNQFVQKLVEQDGKPSLEILHFTQQYSLDIIAETSMNIKMETLKDGNMEYLNASNDFLELNAERSFHFWQHNPVIYKIFSESAKKAQEAVRLLHRVSKGIIAERHAREKRENITATDNFGMKRKQALIDTLFQNRVQAGLSDGDIQAEVDTFMFAGFDTVSRALAFGLYSLAQNLEVQNRIYEEITSVFDGDVQHLTQTQVNQFSYLDMVVKEILRMYPPVPLIERTMEEDVRIGGRFIPKGIVVSMLLHQLNMNPQYFPEPEKFDPERFSPENQRNIPTFGYVPFSAGPRNCIGQKFALLEMKLAIVHVLKELQILPVPGHKLNIVYKTLLDSTTGILIRIKKRE